jgi:hypothetical protein
LEDAQGAATSALLMQENGEQDAGEGCAAAEVLELGPALYKVARVSSDGRLTC